VNLLLKRDRSSAACTLGSLYVDDVFAMWTLEDVVRAGPKVPGETAIPAGTYLVVIDDSVRFARLMPHVLDVPQFDGVRIHAGNVAADTRGCILVGLTRGPDRVSRSREAFERLYKLLWAALALPEPVTLTVLDAEPYVAPNPTAP
jgi:hypothetical protein